MWEYGEHIEGHSPSPFGPYEDAYEWQELVDNAAQPDELTYALKILDRYRVWLRLAGRDY